MDRSDGRTNEQMRQVVIQTGVQRFPHGSVQVSFGQTIVLCAATVAEKVPPWIEQKKPTHGWITSEYSMLPGATTSRSERRTRGRSEEIQRLIGRSLRSCMNLAELGKRTITLDCDVLQADGSTRSAAITGGYVALTLALRKLVSEGQLPKMPLLRQVCAVSCVWLDDKAWLDPDYKEDSQAEVDMNFVIDLEGRFVEIQGTAEKRSFDLEAMKQMSQLAQKGAQHLFELQKRALAHVS